MLTASFSGIDASAIAAMIDSKSLDTKRIMARSNTRRLRTMNASGCPTALQRVRKGSDSILAATTLVSMPPVAQDRRGRSHHRAAGFGWKPLP